MLQYYVNSYSQFTTTSVMLLNGCKRPLDEDNEHDSKKRKWLLFHVKDAFQRASNLGVILDIFAGVIKMVFSRNGLLLHNKKKRFIKENHASEKHWYFRF